MTIEHKNITDAERHEPKGASTAANGTVYVSNGAGSGAWSDNTAYIKNANKLTLNVDFSDISSPDSVFVVCPVAGKIQTVYVTLHNAITVANSIVTAKIAGVAVGGFSLTITQAGSAAGSTFSASPASANTVTAGQAIEIITDGGSTTTCQATVTILVNTA